MALSKRIGFALALLHFLLWSSVVYSILSGLERDWPMYWTIFLAIDFPVSLIYLVISYPIFLLQFPSHLPFLPGNMGDLTNFILPVVFFGLVGTWWWFVLPQLLSKFFSRTSPSPDFFGKMNIFLRIATICAALFSLVKVAVVLVLLVKGVSNPGFIAKQLIYAVGSGCFAFWFWRKGH